MDRVTRLGELAPIRRLLILGSFLKITKVAQLLRLLTYFYVRYMQVVSTKNCVLLHLLIFWATFHKLFTYFRQKYVLGYILSNFSQTRPVSLAGHLGSALHTKKKFYQIKRQIVLQKMPHSAIAQLVT
jgi:hypothetical protein